MFGGCQEVCLGPFSSHKGSFSELMPRVASLFKVSCTAASACAPQIGGDVFNAQDRRADSMPRGNNLSLVTSS